MAVDDQDRQLEELRRQRHAHWSGQSEGSPSASPRSAPGSGLAQHDADAVDTSGDEAFARRLHEELNREEEVDVDVDVDDDDDLVVVDGDGSEDSEEVSEEVQHGGQTLAAAAGRLAFNTAGALVNALVTGAQTLLGGSQIERDEAFARRLQAEEEARARGLGRAGQTSTSNEVLGALLHQLGGFAVPARAQQGNAATTTTRRVNEIILPGFGNGIRVRLVSSRSGGAPALVPMPIGGRGRRANHPLQQFLNDLQFGQEMSYEELLELQERMGYHDRGASEEQIGSLPVRAFKGESQGSRSSPGGSREGEASASSDQTTCAICLDDYSDGQEMRTLPCMHSFHSTCVDKWLRNNRSCPVCKKDIC
ncbi:hypothetical protein A3770_02p14810 [Chloropicon primus]|uniref:RING-type E3 ubiquitin transferase n=2 Tax=Chloropicon primus TaxID=1764295 RepID=A0A5B8MET4_9CHLO|nr:hypothetical protein A3770_02p14810 [Chloropicon primus]|eukprot:QDZ18963.1 hypothetical protein A3770_02p14810 [Chloropicon primus]